MHDVPPEPPAADPPVLELCPAEPPFGVAPVPPVVPPDELPAVPPFDVAPPALVCACPVEPEHPATRERRSHGSGNARALLIARLMRGAARAITG
jgi:hypothetical protein